jgi:hypothetical protein
MPPEDAAPMAGANASGHAAAARGGPAERVRTNTGTSPDATNSQMISDSVHAVTTRLTPNSAQSRRSRASVMLTSFVALRAMIAMTAAPIP